VKKIELNGDGDDGILADLSGQIQLDGLEPNERYQVQKYNLNLIQNLCVLVPFEARRRSSPIRLTFRLDSNTPIRAHPTGGEFAFSDVG
jgi:hypothetical protein